MKQDRKTIQNTLERYLIDLVIGIVLTLICTPFVLISPLNETPVRIIISILLFLFLPGCSLTAALFPGKEDLYGIGLSITVVPLLGPTLNYTPYRICWCRYLLWSRICGGGGFGKGSGLDRGFV